MHPVSMTATFKSGVHETVQHFFGIAIPYKAGRDAQDVGIVVFAGQFR